MVPLITAIRCFQEGRLLIITFDESDGEGPEGLQRARRKALAARDGFPACVVRCGKIGAVLLSPFIKPALCRRS